MNAVRVLAAAAPAGSRVRRRAARFDLDLAGFLNAATRAELTAMCDALGLAAKSAGEARQRLWAWGAGLERERSGLTIDEVAVVQRVPILDGAKLVWPREARAEAGALPAARAARWPESDRLPREIPAIHDAPAATHEPTTLDELLERATALVGVRLGGGHADKGFHGHLVAELLGLERSASPSPDWRGEVEVKTLNVVRGRGGRWRLKDTPALSMRSVDARQKLHRVLWVVRVDEGEVPGSPVLSWFYQELDLELAHAFERARHLRPKGQAGTRARGWYLRRDFFVACGLMRSLNGD